MKSNLFALAAVVICAALWAIGCSAADKYTSDVKVLPEAAQQVLKDNFNTLTLAQIKIDNDEYEVKYTDGTEVEFTKAGAVKEVKPSAGLSVPDAIIPAPVKAYVDSVYPGQKVIKYESGKEIEVKVSSGIELKFDRQGKFLRID